MSSNRARTRDARARAKAAGESYTTALRAVTMIRRIAAAEEISLDEAEQVYDDPGNQMLCGTCGWTMGMICPECAKGCGCVPPSECDNYRHRDWGNFDTDDDPQDYGCPECGGGANDYVGGCICP